MALNCPICRAGGTLKITHRLELPPDDRSDEVALQVVACSGCGLEAAAIYEESRRGASESFDHFAFKVDELSLARMKKLISACPSQDNRGCRCAAHTTFAGEEAYRQVTQRLPLSFS